MRLWASSDVPLFFFVFIRKVSLGQIRHFLGQKKAKRKKNLIKLSYSIFLFNYSMSLFFLSSFF